MRQACKPRTIRYDTGGFVVIAYPWFNSFGIV